MLKVIEKLPPNVIGLRAEGKVTRKDYEEVLIPLLREARSQGRRVRFLYQLGEGFSGLTAGAMWEDFHVGLKFLRLFERIAVVTDVDWIRGAAHAISPLVPCSTQVFRNEEMPRAIDWIGADYADAKLQFELRDDGVLVLRPNGPLRREDFDQLASVVDPWIEAHHELRGVVVCAKAFPGWENVGSFIEHLDFVKDHHRKVRRVALAADGNLPELAAKVAKHFIKAEVKHFPFEQVDQAITWAMG